MKSIAFSLLLFSLMIFACNGPSASNQNQSKNLIENLIQKIMPPISNVELPTESFSFDNSLGEVFKTNNGSLVSIPKNAFVDKNGKPIQGKVVVKLTEMITLSDIVLSGIPMNVKDKDGETKPFISDGMFNIEAKVGDEAVEIATDKALSVAMPSKKNNTDFDYWYFNKESNEWENISDRDSLLTYDNVIECSKNTNEEQTEEVLKSVSKQNATMSDLTVKDIQFGSQKDQILEQVTEPSKPFEAKKEDFVFNIRADISQYEELQGFKNVLWHPVGKVDTDKITKDVESAGANVELKSLDANAMTYQLKCGNSEYKVVPVLIGNDLKKAKSMYQSKMKEYESVLKEKKNKELKAQKGQMLYNYFNVKKLGIYNCDRFYSNPSPKSAFDFKVNGNVQTENLYVLLSDNTGVIRLSQSYQKDGHFALIPSALKAVICLDSEGNLFESKIDKTSKNKEDAIVCDLQPNFKTIKSSEDFEEIINKYQ
jgi:hypothetical protein